VARKEQGRVGLDQPRIHVATPQSTHGLQRRQAVCMRGNGLDAGLTSTSNGPVNGGAPVQSSTGDILNRTLAWFVSSFTKTRLDPGSALRKLSFPSGIHRKGIPRCRIARHVSRQP